MPSQGPAITHDQLEAIIAAILSTGAVEPAGNTPQYAVDVFKDTLAALRQSGGIPPR
jgi:hypothetical protein